MIILFKIGKVEIENRIIAGPMAGYTNSSYRQIAKEYGVGLVYSEMISDKALIYNSSKTFKMIESKDTEHPLAIQLFGGEIECLVKASKIIENKSKADILDINLGCPAPKVIKGKAGSYWLKNPEKIYEMVKAVVESISVPVTVKIRLGWDVNHINVLEVSKLVEKAGASAIAIHARTKSQLYQGKSDWSYIKLVKENVSIPVIGNGDVKTKEDVKRMLEETGCDAVMVARGALGNPWLFSSSIAYLEGQQIEEPTFTEKKETCLRHARYLIEEMGEKIAMKEMRSLSCFYVKGIKDANPFKVRLCNIETYQELVNILDEIENNIN